MSHWTSGLPKLDLEPFDPSQLYAAVEQTTREQAATRARRRSHLLPVLLVVGLAVAAGVAVGMMTLLG